LTLFIPITAQYFDTKIQKCIHTYSNPPTCFGLFLPSSGKNSSDRAAAASPAWRSSKNAGGYTTWLCAIGSN